ncbi:MAG: hypothetical protein V1839_00060, partial [archaeon]
MILIEFLQISVITVLFVLTIDLYDLYKKITEGHIKGIYKFIIIFALFIVFSEIISLTIKVYSLPTDPWESLQHVMIILGFVSLIFAAYQAFEASQALGFIKSAFVKNIAEGRHRKR